MSATVETIEIRCDRCNRERQTRPTAKGEPRLPGGWKRHMGAIWCDACWRQSFALRAITLPVAGPLGAEWNDLRAALRECWANATQLANWAVTELAKADVVRTPDMERLRPMPRVYLYPGARKILPEMDTGSVVSLLQAAEKRYRAARYDVVWRRAASLPTFRYPIPYPVHNQRWKVREEEGKGLILSAPLAGRRWDLILKTGGRWRQRAAVRRLIAGEAVAGELAIYERGSNVMAKMVMWLPVERPDQRELSGTLYVRTTEDAVWRYHVEDEEPRHLYADQVRRWIAAHKRRSERARHDLKAERRSKAARQRHLEDVAPNYQKHYDRIDSWTHEATAMLANYAARRRVACVVYDDSVTGYADLPWHWLRDRLSYKLDAHGIEFVHASGGVIKDSPVSLESAN